MTARSHLVKKARKDYPEVGIKKGESYYWWKFNFSRMIYRSKTPPKRSQLIHSPFLAQVADIEDQIQSATYDDWESIKDSVVSDLESLRDEQEEKRSNMPEQLQECDSGNTLQERYDGLDEMINELGAVDIEEIDEEDVRQEVESELKKEENETEEDFKARVDEEIRDRVETKKEESLEEFHDVSYQGP